MSIEKISERDVARASMEGVANRPNDRTGFGNSGMTPQQLKERHSALAKLAIGKLNEVIEAFGDEESEGDLLSVLYLALEDEHDMNKKMTLAAWIDRIEGLVARATPLDVGKVWTATESGAGAWKDPPPGIPGKDGADGTPGKDGADGAPGEAGSSIKSIAKTGTSGLVDTYTITLTDGSTFTFTVTNGKDGADGSGGGGGTTVTVGGAAVGTFDADTKLDKSTATGYTQVYGIDSTGAQKMYKAGASATSGYLVQRSGTQIVVPTTPTGTTHAASKAYVDSAVANAGGGGGEALMSTVLFKGDICIVQINEMHDFGYRDVVYLADEIRPSTTYAITLNDRSYTVTSDEDGMLEAYDLEYVDGRYFGVYAEGNELHIDGVDPDYHVEVTVSGPTAMVSLGAVELSGSSEGTHTLALPPQKHATLYFRLQFDGDLYDEIIAVPLDENSKTVGGNVVVAQTDGVRIYAEVSGNTLTWDARWEDSDPATVYNAVLYVTTEAGNVSASGATSSGGASSGTTGGTTAGSKTVFIGYMQHYNTTLDYGRRYLLKLTVGSWEGQKTRFYVFENGDVYGLDPTPSTPYSYVSFDGAYLTAYCDDEYGCVLEITELAAFENISCFIEGTEVLLRDPASKTIYTKRIEDVLPFEYAAYWSPEKGRLTATRVVAPPIVGECTEYDRLTFSNGTTVDVFGVQFFWNVDTDRLQNWADMEPGTRVCTSAGDIVEYVGSEHIVSDVPVKHVTLLTFMGRYIANGIQVGDKRELILPRLLQPERIKYYRMLPQKDRDNLKRVCDAGMKRRNRKFSREYVETKRGFAERRRVLLSEQSEAEKYLADTDYQVIKLTEGVLSEEEFAPTRNMRAGKRAVVNRCRTDAAVLDAEEADALAAVERQILDTYVPKRAGKFAGKTRAVLEEETV